MPAQKDEKPLSYTAVGASGKTPDPSSPPDNPPEKEPEIEVVTKQEMESSKPEPPPPPEKSVFRSKKAVIALVLFLILIDIPIGYRLYQQYTTGESTKTTSQASGPSPTSAPPTAVPTQQAVAEPTETETAQESFVQDTAQQGTIRTHAECFEGTCIEIEGEGIDQCAVDADCIAAPGANFPAEESTPAASPTSVSGKGGAVADETASPSATTIPVPDTPAAGHITKTILTLLSGLALLAIALLL